ncbi:MAG TPA: CoA transferase [Caulobacteraceae bacterium]|nr:CoA transferase [Caulobacteraceae bacterium]
MGTGLFGDLLVVDCASYVAGPAAATIMSDFGARVIKIEPPGEGDAYRTLIKYRGVEDCIDYFWALDSRNKESVALDLKDPEGRAFLDVLIKKADVFITNYPFPVRERLKLRAEDVMPLNKRLIYASLSPYGEAGPERDRTGFDATAWWARSGLMDMVRATGDTELAMSVPGMGDHPTSMAMYAAIVTALYRRQQTGEGSEVTTSLMANGLWANGCQVQAALCDLELVPRAERGQRNPLVEFYTTSDGREFTLAMVNMAREWPLLLQAVGKPEWADDELFSTPLARFQNGDLLATLLGDVFGGEPWSHWSQRLSEAGLTFGLVGRITDHPSDPQLEANGLLPEFADGLGLKTLDSPFNIKGEPKAQPRMAPTVGQHTDAVRKEFGAAAAAAMASAGGD